MPAITVAPGKELYVIYNKITGFIEGGAGIIDKEKDSANLDGSTLTERIPKILDKDPDKAILFLPVQELPDPEKHKIEDDKIVDLTEDDLIVMEESKPLTKIEQLKKRVALLEGK
ncbi:MAG: hypothetical protein DRH26_02195 [Deltaproteobacteria bacterium]|nr:MAG: hypothetical protein DRH26_02195 [Deltaproteobacteria bacterium]